MKTARDAALEPTEDDEDDEEADPVMTAESYRTWCENELNLSAAQIDALVAKYYPAEDEEGGEAAGAHPPDFNGRPHTGGEMTKTANDVLTAIDKLPKAARKALRRQVLARGAQQLAADQAIEDRRMALDARLKAAGMATDSAGNDRFFKLFPHAARIKIL